MKKGTAMGKLILITGKSLAGKSMRLTRLANSDPKGIYLGVYQNEYDTNERQQSRILELNKSVPFINTILNEPSAMELKKRYPAFFTIYVDEAQGRARCIKDYLDNGFTVYAAGVTSRYKESSELWKCADVIYYLKGGKWYINDYFTNKTIFRDIKNRIVHRKKIEYCREVMNEI